MAGTDFEFDPIEIERLLGSVEPEAIKEHFVVVGGRRYPPKQVLAVVTGLDRADFTTHQARAILRGLGFGTHRRSANASLPRQTGGVGPHGGAEAGLLAEHVGRWVAQDGLEVLFDADSPEMVVRWLRRHGRQARVWRIPAGPGETGSSSSTP